MLRPHLKCCVQFWATTTRNDPEAPERVWKRATELEHRSCKEWLRELGVFSLEKKKAQGDCTVWWGR